VSKPVLYRYFADKADLHAAVGTWGAGVVMERLLPALLSGGTVKERVDLGCEAYLAAIEEHPNVFLLLVAHRVESDADPLADGKAAIAAAMARVLGDTLRELGVDAAGAEPWAHGLVGLGLSTGEWWLTRRTMSRAAVRGYLAAFVWHAFEGLAREYGVDLADHADHPDDADDSDDSDERGSTP
jgi:AcrR family transcriptional regulator